MINHIFILFIEVMQEVMYKCDVYLATVATSPF